MNAPADFTPIKARQQAAWASGDYAVIGTTLQIVGERLPMLPHDLPVDFLVTPNEVIATRPAHPRPRGLYWDLLRPLRINAIPLLRKRLQRGTAGASPRRV